MIDTMTGEDISQRVRKIVEHYSGAVGFAPDAQLARDLKLDSLDLLSVAMACEDEFGIDIPDADVDRPELGTVRGLAEYIEDRVNGRE